MKKLLATAFIAGSLFAVSACDTTGHGNVDHAPYEMERTAGGDNMGAHNPNAYKGDRVFRRNQTK